VLSYLLLATVGVHALMILYQARPGTALPNQRWRHIALGLLLAAVLGALFLPRLGGYLVGVFWAIFLIFPMYGEAEIRQAVRAQNWPRAQRWARRIGRVVHRTAWDDAAAMYEISHHISRGQLGVANDMLQQYRPTAPMVVEWFRWQRLNLQADWAELRQEAEMALQQPTPSPDTGALMSYFRAAAAINDPSAFLAAFERYHAAITHLPREIYVYCFVMLFAAVGRPDLMARAQSLFQATYPAYLWNIWLGSAYLNSGDQATAHRLFQEVTQHGDAALGVFVLRYAEGLKKAARAPLAPEQQALLARLEAQWSQLAPVAP
jgi:hypothetical protein